MRKSERVRGKLLRRSRDGKMRAVGRSHSAPGRELDQTKRRSGKRMTLQERHKREKRMRNEHATGERQPHLRPNGHARDIMSCKLASWRHIINSARTGLISARFTTKHERVHIGTFVPVGFRTHTYTSCTSGSSCAMHPMRDGSKGESP